MPYTYSSCSRRNLFTYEGGLSPVIQPQSFLFYIVMVPCFIFIKINIELAGTEYLQETYATIYLLSDYHCFHVEKVTPNR